MNGGQWLNLIVEVPGEVIEKLEELSLVLAGLRRPDAGEVIWNGRNVWDNLAQFRCSVRYISSTPEVYPELSLWENMKLYTELFSLRGTLDQWFEPLDRDDDVTRLLDQNEIFKLKLATLFVSRRSLLICAYPISRLGVEELEILEEKIKDLLNTGKIIITLDLEKHPAADFNRRLGFG